MNYLAAIRKNSGVTQQAVADYLGVTRQAYGHYETSTREPDFETLLMLGEYFAVTVDEILRGSAGPSAHRVRILGRIPAGIPIEAIEDYNGWEEIPADWTAGGKEYFALKIQGDCMEPEYRDGDVVIFLKAETCDSGSHCAVIVNGQDAIFKKVIRRINGVVLQPLNTNYEPSIYSNEEIEELPVRVIGVAKELRRKT